MAEPTPNIPSLREIVDTDEAALRKEFYRRSLDYFLLMIKKEPANIPAWGHCGLLLYELGEFDEALSYFRKIIESEPDNAVAWDAVGFVSMERGDFGGAAAAFGRVIGLSPKRADVAADLALCFFKGEEYAAAREVLTGRVGKLMGTKEFYLMGRIAEHEGDDPSEHFTKALTSYRPPEGPVREGVFATLNAIRGVILSRLKRDGEARRALVEAGSRASLTDPDRMILSAVDLTFKVRGAFIEEVRSLGAACPRGAENWTKEEP
jgi:tetratricopeptide (TPR) repeat protein